MKAWHTELVTVCDQCLQASCWQGEFYCHEDKTAGTKQMTRKELAKLGRENSDYWMPGESELNHGT
jgi:epoxyqueuosine reductase QueG